MSKRPVNKALFYLLLFLITASACKKEKKPDPPVTPVEFTFAFYHDVNPNKLFAFVACSTTDGKISANLPFLTDDRTALIATFTLPDGATLKANDVVQVSGVTVNDFSKPLVYTLTKADGTVKTYTANILKYSGLPIFYLTTQAPVVSKDDYVTGNLVIDPNSQFTQDITSIDLQIKGRGNSTWDMPKKPYRLKFNSKTPVLGFSIAKNWVLLANYSDKTLMRNAVAFEMGKQFAADFTPKGRFIDVVMNGQYIGNYYLTQQVEVDTSRINIKPIKATDNTGDALTGGYLLELDQRLDADFYFFTHHGLPMTINTPDPITPQQLAYITDYVTATEDAIFAANFADPVNGYAKYINVDSFISWFLVKELVKDNDGKDYSSIYYYKDRNGKLGMGPVWDFDLAIGNTDYSDCKLPQGWWVKNSLWFSRLFEDPAFKLKVKNRWNELYAQKIPALLTYMDQTSNYISSAAYHNFTKWDILNVYVWPNPVVTGSYPNEVSYTKDWLRQRISWMNAEINK
ncbi:MAG TPA: CotH kinase family protein [Mucilaginibacter sp.]|nr:CotH kinase family protein [Mucilaginibacter sp.]